MTRKDYRMIAGVLNNYSTEQKIEQHKLIEAIANALAVHMKQDNPRFQKDRFIQASTGGE